MTKTSQILLFYCLFHFSIPGFAMGIRSFVALPIEEGGSVIRTLMEYNVDSDMSNLTANLAYGMTGSQTLMAGMPYRISGGKGDRLGNVSLMYRHTIWQIDEVGSTYRIGLLGGGLIPTDTNRNGRLLFGGVFTRYWSRHEIDVDILWGEGLSNMPDSSRYDVSWQYRLSPEVYPEWGIPSQWNSVLEISGRWASGNQVTHFLTVGVQRIWPRWVIEGGISQDLNGNKDTKLIFSIRRHH